MNAADTTAAIGAMMTALQQQGQAVAALLQQQQQQQAAAAPHPAAAPAGAASSRVDGVKLPALEQYAGGEQLEPWLMALRHRFDWYGEGGLSEQRKVELAAQHLSLAALSWWDSIRGSRPTTFDAFVAALKRQFQHVDTALEARVKLTKLRQGAKQSVQEFAAQFRLISTALPNESDEARVFTFLHALRPELAGEVYRLAETPANLGAAIDAAARLDARNHLGLTMANRGAIVPSRDPNAMDLDHMEDQASSAPAWKQEMLAAMRQEFAQWRGGGRGDAPGAKSRSGKIPGVSKEQVAERRRAGSCFQCGEKGHQIRDCPASN
jgi:hypothetical protein